MKFKTIVDKFADAELAPLGGETDPRTLSDEERQRLREDVQHAIASNRGGYITAVSLIVVLFLLNALVVLTQLGEPIFVQGMTAAVGVSAAGLITWMMRLWSDKSRLEMLAVFAVNLEGEALKTLLNVLASKSTLGKS